MAWFCWHVSGWSAKAYPVLWADAPSAESHSPNKAIVRQRHKLTPEDEAELSTTGINGLAKKYPYNEPMRVDSGNSVVIVQEVTHSNRIEEIEP